MARRRVASVRGRQFLTLALVLVVATTGAILYAMRALSEDPLDAQRTVLPLWGEGTRVSLDYRSPSVLTGSRSDSEVVLAAREVGVVTDVPDATITSIRTGQVLYEVNNRPILATVSEEPPFSPLRMGDSGPAVESQVDVLRVHAYLAPDDDLVEGEFVVGRQTMNAVTRFVRDLGYPSSVDEPDVLLSSLVWVPTSLQNSSWEVDDEVALGGPAPVYPAPLLSTVSQLIDASVLLPNEGQREWRFEAESFSVGVDQDGIVSIEDLEVIPLEDLGTEPLRIEGAVSATTADELWVVPASALVVGPSGEFCLVLRRDGVVAVEQVDVVPARVPGTAIERDLTGITVLFNPDSGSESYDSRCRSS